MHNVKRAAHPDRSNLDLSYAGRDFCQPVPRYTLPEQGMSARNAYQLLHDEMRLDAQPALNLASFITTWMEPEANALMAETAAKNLIDHDEYGQTSEIENRVVNMMAHLLHAPGSGAACGATTVGSSEAIMLGLLAHKRAWQKRRAAAGKPTHSPNFVFGADAHTCLEKFARYFDVEPRLAPMAPHNYVVNLQDMAQRIDENTIAVAAIVGTTYTGQMDPVGEIDTLLRGLHAERGWTIPLHVDAASGGFVLPFTRPDVVWDFRLPSVRSINVSNHKFGLVYPGIGSLLFRERADLPEELIFHINYLGGDMPNYSLNFSRPSAPVVAQYYNFLRLGQAGYTRIMQNIMTNARYLAEQLRQLGGWQVIGDGTLFPVIVARAAAPEQLDVFAVSKRLRAHGWVVPAYTLPAHAEHVAVLRMVVRESLSRDLIDKLLADLQACMQDRAGKSANSKRPVC